MKYTTYVLRSLKDGNLYIGSTNNINRRITDHNSGKNKSTKCRRPLILVYKEDFNNIMQARNREKVFKKSHSILFKVAGWKDSHR